MKSAARDPRKRSPLAVIGIVLLGCHAPQPSPPAAVRLADLFKANTVTHAGAAVAPAIPRVEWRFDGTSPTGASATRGWQAGPGVTGLMIRDGHLTGRTTTDLPILHVERTDSRFDADLLQSIEVRIKATQGGELAISNSADQRIDLAKVLQGAKDFPWEMKTPLIAADEFQTYSLTPAPPTITSADIRHLFVRPTDRRGPFEIESVRLIFRKEYLASIPSGVSWQGLSGIFYESIVTRSGDTARFDVDVSSRSWLDLTIGTVEDGPVTFRVEVSAPPSNQKSDTGNALLLERTVTTPHRWELVPIDLSRFGSTRTTLALSVRSAQPGAIGFWGSPVVRTNGATAAAPVARADSSRGDPPRGIVVIWADTLRRDHLDLYGHSRETAPALRRTAAEGVMFRHCITQATWTKVSTPSLMTSLYPTSHGVKSQFDRIPASATTIAEVYRDAGYATFSYASNNFTGRMTNLHQGFEQLHEDTSLPDRRSSKTFRVGLDRVLPWIEAHREVPFFVFMSILDPHDPYKPYAPYDALWADPATEIEHTRQTEKARKYITQPILKLFGMPSREELVKAGIDPDAYVRHDQDWYDGSIRGMDAEIARLLERLRSLGLAENTLVVFTADHGEEFLEHGRMFHGQSAYGELNLVPLVLWRPGTIPKAAVVDEPVETIDLMPTLLEMSRLRLPKEAQGQSLVPLLLSAGRPSGDIRKASMAVGDGSNRETQWKSRPAITEKWASVDDRPPLDTDSVSIVSDGWKLVHNTRRHAGTPEYELYDFLNDQLDQKNVADAHPEIVQRLAKSLERWRSLATAAQLKPDAELPQTMSAEQLQRLKSLGYIK
jgi:arylsulfatase A-like enzyme